MSIKITIPNSSSDVLTFGSGNTPTAAQIAGIDSGSSNGQLALYTTASGTSTERVRVDSSGNVGVGTSSPGSKLEVYGLAGTTTPLMILKNATPAAAGNITQLQFYSGNTFGGLEQTAAITALNPNAGANNGGALVLSTSANGTATTPTERMRIDASGNLLVGTTAQFNSGKQCIAFSGATHYGMSIKDTVDQSSARFIGFINGSGTAIGGIDRVTTTNAVQYLTSSDYRLKDNVQPMAGALAKVQVLKPCTYTWKEGGETDEGFIAHELQEVFPSAVSGSKDAVDAEGKPVYQGIDTSFLVATLTAAIQEQQAIITSLTDRITALEGATS